MTRRYHLAAFLALAIWSAGLPPARAEDLADDQRIAVARRLQQSTVSVRTGRSGGGSGFVAGEDKWIVTNAHVVRGRRSQHVRVRFGTGEERAARIVAYDPSHDLAILRVQGEVPVDALPLGTADEVEVGQTVLAFGSPFGLDGTLTQGIVSARRDLPAIGGGDVKGLIQTDAPINPGNSGGPLVDAKGRVIGVNTAILSRTGGSHGIGFAVPVSYVKGLLAETEGGAAQAQHRDRASKRRVWLGVWGDDFRGRGVSGVRIQRVYPGGPADRAGLLGTRDPAPGFVRRLQIPWTGHIILAVDGSPVRSMRELQRRLASHEPGDQVTLLVTVGPGVVSGEMRVRLGKAPKAPRRARP